MELLLSKAKKEIRRELQIEEVEDEIINGYVEDIAHKQVELWRLTENYAESECKNKEIRQNIQLAMQNIKKDKAELWEKTRKPLGGD